MSLVGQKLFDTFDVNKDGSVSIDEVVQGFKLFDKNDDGSISQEEWTDIYVEKFGGSKEEAVAMFAKFLKNERGSICSDSFKKIFNDMDNNGDGVVTKDEFEVFWGKLCQ